MTTPMLPLRRIFKIVNGGTPTADETNWDGDIPWATPADFGDNLSELTSTRRTVTRLGALTGSAIVPAGSILVSTRAPIGHIAITQRDAAFNQGCRALVPAVDLVPRYFGHQLESMRQELNARGLGTTFMELSSDNLSAIPVWVPPVEEQRRIADFLDAETAHIDRIFEMRKAQIDLLNARRWSHFEEALNAVDAPIIPLRRVLCSIIDGPFGSAFSSNDYANEGAIVIRLGNIGFAEYRSADQAHIPMEMFDRFRSYEVKQGDLLIAGLGDSRNHAGRACVAPDLGAAIVKGKCFRARLSKNSADSNFISLLLSSPIGAGSLEGRGSTRSMINLDIVKSALLPIPEISQQRKIVQLQHEAWDRMSSAIQACDRQLALLAERRQTLITAAVTGQIDVSTASGRGVTEGKPS